MPKRAVVEFSINFVVMDCGGCDISFAVPDTWYQQRVRDKRGWTCPNGCNRVFTSETVVERLEREKKELQAQLNEETHARLVAQKQSRESTQELARLKNRVTHGVCPCCNRTFANLSRHMKSKHPQEIAGSNTPQIGPSTIN